MKNKQLNKKIFGPRLGLFVIAGILLVLIPSGASAGDVLYSVAQSDDLLRVINPSTGATISSVQIILPASLSATYEIQNVNGLATQPGTNTLFALLTLREIGGTARSGRELVTIDTATGDATSIGNTGDYFGDITFSSTGTLYGVTGEQGGYPSTLFEISTADATSTLVVDFVDNVDNFAGEAIAYKDGLIYRASGEAPPFLPLNELRIFESYDPSTATFTSIGITGVDFLQIQALVYDQSSGNFLAAAQGQLVSVTPAGVATLGPALDHQSHGLAFAPAPAGGAIPEFPTVALPIVSVIGLMFLFQRRKGK